MIYESTRKMSVKEQEAYDLGYLNGKEAALRGPQPDPITGLVPCGCGGKAQLGKLQYTISDPDLMPEYYAYCQDCGITTENSADRERVEAAWNHAMGMLEVDDD